MQTILVCETRIIERKYVMKRTNPFPKIFAILLASLMLFLTGCQTTNPSTSGNESPNDNVASETPNDTDSNETTSIPNVTVIQDKDDDFAFSFFVKNGSFVRGEKIEICVDLISTKSSYEWTGPYSYFRAIVKLVCLTDGVEYIILPDEMPDTTDCGTHKVELNEKRSTIYYFNIPIDAVPGDYALICTFMGSKAKFIGSFKLS